MIMGAERARDIATEKVGNLYNEDLAILRAQLEKLIEFEASHGRFQTCFCAGRCDCESYQSFKNIGAMIEIANTLKGLGYKVKLKKDAAKSVAYYYLDISWKEPIKNAACNVLGNF